jgi:hypothetical protein
LATWSGSNWIILDIKINILKNFKNKVHKFNEILLVLYLIDHNKKKTHKLF